MAARPSSWLLRPALLKALLSQVRLAWRLLREPAVPTVLKTVPVLAALYVVSPLDIVPDVLPLLGQLDDVAILVLALQSFAKVCPSRVVEYHRAALARGRAYSRIPDDGDSIDAEFRRE